MTSNHCAPPSDCETELSAALLVAGFPDLAEQVAECEQVIERCGERPRGVPDEALTEWRERVAAAHRELNRLKGMAAEVLR